MIVATTDGYVAAGSTWSFGAGGKDFWLLSLDDSGGAGVSSIDAALWWPESAAQAHNDVDVHLIDPAGVERSKGYSAVSVFERARVAVESGEVSGVCMGWDSLRATWRKALEAGDVVIVLQVNPRALPEIAKVPLAINLAKSEEGRRLIEVGVHDLSAIFRPYVLPPGTPGERVEILRRAFLDTMKDPEFLVAAEKATMTIDPVPGEEVKKIVAGLFQLPPALLAKLKDVLKW